MSLEAFDTTGPANSNVELVRDIWAAIGEGDQQLVSKLLAEDIVWTIPEMPNVPFAGCWQGRQKVREFFDVVDAVQEVIEFAPKEIVAEGSKVVVLGHFANRIRKTGRISRSNWAQVWTVRNGQVVSMNEFVDTHAVISAFEP